MMKKVMFGVIIAIMLFYSISALTLDIKDSFQMKETGMAKISGDIREPISKSQVNFYKGHVLVSSFEYDLVKIGNDYYVWFITPNSANNYSIEVKEVFSVIGGVPQTTTLTKNFSVIGNLSDYYIVPGAIISNQDFEIKFVLNEDSPKTISINYPEVREVLVNPGQNFVKFSLSSLDKTKIVNINAGRYIIPSYLITKNVNINTTGNATNGSTISSISLEISPKRIERTSDINNRQVYPIEIFNLGNNISGIEIKYNNKVLAIDSNIIDFLESNKSTVVNLSIIGSNDVEEVITILAGNFSFNLPVKVSFSDLNDTNQTGTTPIFDCEIELGGKLCTIDEICTKGTEQSKQGSCCLGECIAASGSGGSMAWIGWIIAVVVLGAIWFLYSKYKKVKPTGNPIEKQVKDIEKRDLTPNFMKK